MTALLSLCCASGVDIAPADSAAVADGEATTELADSPLLPVADSPASGADDAWVTVVVFADFQCPFSARLAATLDEVFDGVDDDGVVRRVFKYNPQPDSEGALIAARAAEAAHRQGQFWAMHDGLFDDFAALGGGDPRPVILEVATEVGLDLQQFTDDLDSDDVAAQVAKDQALAAHLELPQGPALFVSGGYIGGVRSHFTYVQAITELYIALRQAVAQGDMERSQVYLEAVQALFDYTRPTEAATHQVGPSVAPVPIGGEAPATGPVDEALVQIGAFINLGADPTLEMLHHLMDELEQQGSALRLTFFHLPDGDDAAARLAHRALEGAQTDQQVRHLVSWLSDGENKWRTDLTLLQTKLQDLAIVAVDDDRFDPLWRADRKVADDHGVYATPTFFFNGLPLIGRHDRAVLQGLIADQHYMAGQLQQAEGLIGWSLYDRAVEVNQGR